MRTTADRIRHAVSFEIIGLLLVTPLAALTFSTPMQAIGVVVIVSATLAVVWTYAFNLGFDHALRRLAGHTRKSPLLRLLHAALFEAGLVLVLMPFIAWYLGISLWAALAMDLSFAAFYVVYALAFNWAYDQLFPAPGENP